MIVDINRKKYHYFWSGVFSQWHMSDFMVSGISFNCAEQFMMYSKAVLFGDEESAQKILATPLPKDQKFLGRCVQGFKQDIWERNCMKIVYHGNYEKFTQNDTLLRALLATFPKVLVEASPYDRVWGIGMHEKDAIKVGEDKWRGRNLLGQVLTTVRDDIMANQRRHKH